MARYGADNFIDRLINFLRLDTQPTRAERSLPFCDAAMAEALILLLSVASLMFVGFLAPARTA
jgi:hypothetical protein